MTLPVLSSVSFRLIKPARPELESSDKRLEYLHAYDDVELEMSSAKAHFSSPSAHNSTVGTLDVRRIVTSSTPFPTELKIGDTLELMYSISPTSPVLRGFVYACPPVSATVEIFVDFIDPTFSDSTSYQLKLTRRSKP